MQFVPCILLQVLCVFHQSTHRLWPFQSCKTDTRQSMLLSCWELAETASRGQNSAPRHSTFACRGGPTECLASTSS
ncbi:hypothetical protein F5Y12DRAFT_745433 [Xylaria sp. FL1777]|nr:hypothetical protein F5Y12DRAFT_745433 [Xylaria sp. FL1777]